MNKDDINLPLSISDQDIKDAASHFSHQILSSGQEGNKILLAARRFPQCVLLQSFAAAFYLFGQTDTNTKKAKKHLIKSELYLTNANLREKMWYQAIIAWSDVNYELAITLLMAIARQWSTDLLAIKLTEWLSYCSGQVTSAKRMLNFCQELEKSNQLNSHFLAIYAFAYELNNDLNNAYRIANQAVDIEFNTPWAHHALAHYYLRSGKIDAGLQALEIFQPSWKNILLLLREHNTWHLALHYLANMNEAKTMEIFKQEIWDHWPNAILEQIDAISLLWRMDMAGMNTDQQWQDIITKRLIINLLSDFAFRA